MAIDEEDEKRIAKLVNSAITARDERNEKKFAELLKAMLSERDEAAKKQAEIEAAEKAEKESKAKGEETEKVTLTTRVKELEARAKAAEEAVKAERLNTSFRSAWTSKKFVPDLADEHMALLRSQERIVIDEAGAVRIRDPKKSKHETQPTLDEYMQELAGSERGKLYQAATASPGAGGTQGGGVRVPGEKMSEREADAAIFGTPR